MKRTKFSDSKEEDYDSLEEKHTLNLFYPNSFFALNRNLLGYCGPINSLLITILLYNMDVDGWSKLTLTQLSEELGCSKNQINNSRKILEHFGLLEIRKKGMPASYQYKINVDKLQEILR